MVLAATVARIGVPLVVAGAGAVAAVAVPDSPVRPVAGVWIDSPAAGSVIAPGQVVVVAHASAGARISAITLTVDGLRLPAQAPVRRYADLVGSQFVWEATPGTHVLVAGAPGIGEERRVVRVVAPGTLGIPGTAPVATATGAPSPTASTTSAPTSTATPTVAPTAPRPTGRPTSPGAQPSPTPTPRPTLTPKPSLGPLNVSPAQVYGGACSGAITVTAQVSGAQAGSARVTAADVDRGIGGSISNGVFTATFHQDELRGTNTSGDFTITVTVTNASGHTTGTTSVSISCSKD